MVRKSVTSFVLGLVGSLFSLFWGFVSGVFGGIGGIIAEGVGSGSGTMLLINLLGWLAFLGAIVGFVGAGNCFKKAKRGAILLTVATVMCTPIQLYYFIKTVEAATTILPTLIIIFLLPVVLLVVATVLAYCAKETKSEEFSYYAQPQQPQQYVQPQSQPQQTGLEAELTNLKGMLDKGLLTEEEYNDAKKNAIAKYTK